MASHVVVPADLRHELRQDELTFVVIGASGWIGRAIIDVLAEALGRNAFQRRVRVLGSQRRILDIAPNWRVNCVALDEWNSLCCDCPVVFNNAFLTRDKVGKIAQTEYLATNRRISDRVLDLCASWRARAVFLPSSGAVYTESRSLERDFDSNPYGALKVEDEIRFAAFCSGACTYVAPRIFGLSGEFINKTDTYVLADVIRQLQTSGMIRLRAERPVYRSYLYVGDLIALSLYMILRGPVSQFVFDTAGLEVVEVGELADRIRQALDRADVPVIRKWDADAKPDLYVGDGGSLQGWAAHFGLPLVGLDEQIRRTADYLANFATSPR